MILNIILRAVIVILCLVFGCRHISFALAHVERKNHGMVGSHVMLTLLWVLIMARAILF